MEMVFECGMSKQGQFGVELEKVVFISYLGVILNNNLKWSNHVSTISGKANRVLGKKPLELPQASERKVYIAIVRPKLE